MSLPYVNVAARLKACLFITALLGCTLFSQAQFRRLGFLFSENLHGGTTMFGNTLMGWTNSNGTINPTAMNGNAATGNSFFDNGGYGTTNMQYIDVDGDTVEGAGTRNSSSADLILPAGNNTIRFARLYWGGRAATTEFNMADPANQTIKIRKGTTGVYTELAAAQIDRSFFNQGSDSEFARYQCFSDITDFIAAHGPGTYTVGNGAFSTGFGGDFGKYGAWCIVVVYANPDEPFNSVRVIDGFQEVYNGGTGTIYSITLTGLNTPSDTLLPAEAKLGTAVWEGDARFNGDFFRVNNIPLGNAVNPVNNIWNGTVTINGAHVTTKNPSYTDQMSIDIDEFYIGSGYGIPVDANSIQLRFGTTQDQYFSGIVTAVIRMKESPLKLSKSVQDENGSGIAEVGETLTYTLRGRNEGTGNMSAVLLTDTLASTMIYVPGSLRVNTCPGNLPANPSDLTGDDIADYNPATRAIAFRLGNDATNATGGILAPQDSFEVEFKVQFNPVANGVSPPIVNVARLTSRTPANEYMVDDATVYIDGATAQQITYTFTGNGNWDVPSNWAGNLVPPLTLPVFSTIIIDHVTGGECILNVPQHLATGSALMVNPGKNLLVSGSVSSPN